MRPAQSEEKLGTSKRGSDSRKKEAERAVAECLRESGVLIEDFPSPAKKAVKNPSSTNLFLASLVAAARPSLCNLSLLVN